MIETEEECGFCGKKIEDYGKTYSLALTAYRPDDPLALQLPDNPLSKLVGHPIWSSHPYCSEECFKKASEKIISDLKSWLQQEDWAKELLRKQGFRAEGF